MSLREELHAKLNDRQKVEYAAFERLVLEECIKPRDGKSGNTFVLDRRNALLGHAGRETLRDPSAEGWPDAGRSTRDAEEARRWARSHYVPRLWQTLKTADIHPSADSVTALDAAYEYIRRRVQTRYDKNGMPFYVLPRKFHSRRSMLRRHIVPLFGNLLMASLTRTMVREAAEKLEITRTDADGRRTRRAAMHGQKLNFVRALTALWNDVFPDVSAPFAGAMLRPIIENDENVPTTVYDLENIQQVLSAEEGKGAMSPKEVLQAMIGAVHRDAMLMSRDNIAPLMIGNTVFLIVLLVTTGARISEVLRIRWCDIDYKRGFILIHQSKRHTNKRGRPKPRLRIAPLQKSLLPWLELLQRESGIADPTGNPSFLIRSSANVDASKMGTQNTLLARLAKTLRYAGVKPVGKTSHWGRSTHASWAKHSPKVKKEEMQHFLGHAAFAGSTEDYVAMLIDMLRDEHCEYIPLPTPEDVHEALAGFKPATYDWRTWRRHQSRTRAAKTARQEVREARRTPQNIDEFVAAMLR